MGSDKYRSLAFLLLIGLPLLVNAKDESARVHGVEVRFIQSPYADYLFYLFYRLPGNYPQLESAVPLTSVPTLEQPVSLPEQAASAQVSSYQQLYPLLKQYRAAKSRIVPVHQHGVTHYRIIAYNDKLPSYQRLETIVKDGQSEYPKFKEFWKTNIGPAEEQEIEGWKQQLKECSPLEKLQQVERLSFPFSHLDVAAIALHLSGSGNTYPAGVYTSLFSKPNLAWVLGHEATHLMVDQYAGHDWRANPLAPKAIELITARGGKPADVEESLTLFMQMKLSQICGYTSSSRRISDSFDAKTPKGAILRSLENGWESYEADPKLNIIDYMLRQSVAALQPTEK